MVVDTLQQNFGPALQVGHMLPEKVKEHLCLIHTEYHGAPREPILLLILLFDLLYKDIFRVPTIYLVKLEQVSPKGLHLACQLGLLLGIHPE